jgi:hypothetical protein
MVSMRYLALLFVSMVVCAASFYVGLILLAAVAMREIYNMMKNDNSSDSNATIMSTD